jgi:mannose-6-phosphate isomerase-like protein (cupin superfamily)
MMELQPALPVIRNTKSEMTMFFIQSETRHDLFKDAIAALIGERLSNQGVQHLGCDTTKPWGVECKITPAYTNRFLETTFDGVTLPRAFLEHPTGPKIICIEQGLRLSWHVHSRKDAMLRVLCGTVGVSMSLTDAEPLKPAPVRVRETVRVRPNIRHRLSGLVGWAIVAEIATDVFPDNPSDDDDTRRIADDFGRDR